MKYKKIHNLQQYNYYCDMHEKLMIEEDEKFQDEIDLLEILIEEYDDRIFKNKYKTLNPVELLKSLLEDANLSQKKFSKQLQISPQLISDILNYRRNISKVLVIKLAEFFAMSQDAFSREYDLQTKEKKNKTDKVMFEKERKTLVVKSY